MKIILSGQNKKKEIIEKLSTLEHKQWEHWAKDILKEENISKERTKRWEEEGFKPYSELSEEMKDFDREWANKVYGIIEEYLK